ncbi:MAG: glycosyl hydrolase, repeat-containing protein [Frankiales bacterium]|nr:glycosyl hydrolase, repeat-containing protein [Frankiales bacterium]
MKRDLERELQRLLHSRDVPARVADPVAAVHTGMRRRRRTQRLQVLSAALGAIVVALGASLVVSNRLADNRSQPTHPTTSTVQPTSQAAPVPPGFRVRDLSFISSERGWALGVVPCGTGECSTLVATEDGGRTWVLRQAPAATEPGEDGTFHANCDIQTCVSSIRFVRTDTGEEFGYAFNPGLAVTTDGGRTWTNQPVQGAVAALEAARGNVVRVLIPQGACPGCTFTIQKQAVGGSRWDDVARPTFDRGVSASLVRQGTRLAVLLRGHTSGGASDARSQLLLSNDNGTTWAQHEDPCGPLTPADEIDAIEVAIADGNGAVVLCQHRSGGPTLLRVSDDFGRTYGPGQAVPAPYTAQLVSAPQGAVVVSAYQQGSRTQHLLRTTDHGRTWTVVATQTGPSASAFLDFTTGLIGTWIGPDHQRLVRTDDAGSTWTDQPFR